MSRHDRSNGPAPVSAQGVGPLTHQPLTLAQGRCLRAWRECRAERPEVQPSTAEVARAMGVNSASAHRAILGLAARGYLVATASASTPRRWKLTGEAAALPHLATLISLAKVLSKCGDLSNADARESIRVAGEQAAAVLRSVVAQCQTMTADQRDKLAAAGISGADAVRDADDARARGSIGWAGNGRRVDAGPTIQRFTEVEQRAIMIGEACPIRACRIARGVERTLWRYRFGKTKGDRLREEYEEQLARRSCRNGKGRRRRTAVRSVSAS